MSSRLRHQYRLQCVLTHTPRKSLKMSKHASVQHPTPNRPRHPPAVVGTAHRHRGGAETVDLVLDELAAGDAVGVRGAHGGRLRRERGPLGLALRCVHVRTVGTHNAILATSTRTAYSLNRRPGGRADSRDGTRPQVAGGLPLEEPALIQREVADVVAESGSKASFPPHRRLGAEHRQCPNVSSGEARDGPSARPPTPIPKSAAAQDCTGRWGAASFRTPRRWRKDLPALPWQTENAPGSGARTSPSAAAVVIGYYVGKPAGLRSA